VPTPGLKASDYHIPPGVVISVPQYVAYRNTEVWGPDAAAFRAGRWLDADTESLKSMEQNFLAVRTGRKDHVQYYFIIRLTHLSSAEKPVLALVVTWQRCNCACFLWTSLEMSMSNFLNVAQPQRLPCFGCLITSDSTLLSEKGPRVLDATPRHSRSHGTETGSKR
jgi:hypothetical protein